MTQPAPVSDTEDRVCLGVVVGAQGVRGWVRVKSFTEDPEWLDAYGPLSDESGRREFDVTVEGRAKGVVVCSIAGIGDRNEAEKLKGEMLFLPKSALPGLEDEDEFYHSDLIGLRAEFADGLVVGKVVALYDFGAGDVMELHGETGGTVMVPFTRAAVPLVDLPGGRVVVTPIPGLLEGPVAPGATGSRKRSAPAAARRRAGLAAASDLTSAPAVAAEEEDWPEEDWN